MRIGVGVGTGVGLGAGAGAGAAFSDEPQLRQKFIVDALLVPHAAQRIPLCAASAGAGNPCAPYAGRTGAAAGAARREPQLRQNTEPAGLS